MSDASPADWLAAIAAALAAVAAIGALLVALLQWRATNRQTDAALLERRMQVYRDVGGAASHAMRFAAIDAENEALLREASHWAKAVFNDVVAHHILRMWELARLGVLNKSLPKWAREQKADADWLDFPFFMDAEWRSARELMLGVIAPKSSALDLKRLASSLLPDI